MTKIIEEWQMFITVVVILIIDKNEFSKFEMFIGYILISMVFSILFLAIRVRNLKNE